MLRGVLISYLAIAAFIGCSKKPVSQIPVSREAVFVESYSPAEVTIRATGYGESVEEAEWDLKKTALFFLLHLGTDPLLSNSEAKNKFEMMAESFFRPANIREFITWEADRVISSIWGQMPNGDEGYKVVKAVRIHTERLKAHLVSQGIVKSVDALAEAVGLPYIMVIPQRQKGLSPTELLQKENLFRHAASSIESYLTSRGYEVLIPDAVEQINQVAKLQNYFATGSNDEIYQLALTMGADIYITFGLNTEDGQASVNLKTYETTTAKALGSETGYSRKRPGAMKEALVEEGMHDATEKVLGRISKYWAKDIKKGVSYKVLYRVNEGFSDSEVETIQEKISDINDQHFKKSKENIITNKSMDYVIWADPKEFGKSSDIYRMLKESLQDDAKIKKVNLNRKLLVLGIHEL